MIRWDLKAKDQSGHEPRLLGEGPEACLHLGSRRYILHMALPCLELEALLLT